MSARAWLNLGLLMLLGGLALLAWLRPNQAPPAEFSLTKLDPSAVTRIRIRRADKPIIEIKRQNGQWRLTAPITLPANEVRVGALLDLAQETSETRYDAAELELDKYGLADPLVSVTLNEQALAFGNINPVTYRRYVQVEDNIYLVNEAMAELETADAAAYAAPRLLPSGSEIRALALSDLKLERADDGRWQSSSKKLSQAGIEALVDSWRQAQAYQVTAYRKDEIVEAPEQAVVELADGQKLFFAVVAREPELILARPRLGVQYHLPAESAESLLDPNSRREGR